MKCKYVFEPFLKEFLVNKDCNGRLHCLITIYAKYTINGNEDITATFPLYYIDNKVKLTLILVANGIRVCCAYLIYKQNQQLQCTTLRKGRFISCEEAVSSEIHSRNLNVKQWSQ